MSERQKSLTKRLIGITFGMLLLASGLWAVPRIAGASTNVTDDGSLSVSINVPLNEIEDGQFCQAYGLASGGTGPYEFTWSGQFTDSDAQDGPLGENQIASGLIDSGRGATLRVDVKDSATPTPNEGWDEVILNIGDDFNEDCGA